jgi:hypothetical protein
MVQSISEGNSFKSKIFIRGMKIGLVPRKTLRGSSEGRKTLAPNTPNPNKTMDSQLPPE